jgi:pimeloyl-ACP methyl ester carboxylesterase
VNQKSLILLPGLHGTDDLFGPLLSVIPASLNPRIVTYPPDQTLSYDALLEIIERQLRCEQEMILIAESFSGPLAVRFAAAHPTRMRAVVLVASFVKSPVTHWLKHFVQPVLFRFPPPPVALRLLLLARSVSQPLAQEVRASIRKVRPEVLAHRLREVLKVDCSSALQQCPVPILYLVAAHDAVVPRSSMETIRKIRPDVQVKTLDGPHMLLQANPAAAWREIELFLKAIDGADKR